MTRTWTETEIAALVDGELEGEAEARALRAVAQDPEAAALAARIRATDALLCRAYPLTPVAVPEALGAAPPSRSSRAGGLRAAAPLHRIAAGVALAVVAAGAAAWLLSALDDPRPAGALALGPVPAEGATHLALERLASGEASPEGLRLAATYLDRDGRPCRELEGPQAVALACRTAAGGWEVLATAALPSSSSASTSEAGAEAGPGFSAASGAPEADPIAEALDAIGAGAAVSPEAEAQLRADWDRPSPQR